MPSLSRESARSLLEAIDNELGRRLSNRRAEVQRLNEALVSSRLTSLDGTYRVKLDRQRSRLEKAKAQGGRPQFIRMLETTLHRIDGEYAQKRENLNRARETSVTFAPIAGGYLRIEAP